MSSSLIVRPTYGSRLSTGRAKTPRQWHPSAFIRHGGFQIFVMFTGGMVAALGLMGWLVSLRSRVEP